MFGEFFTSEISFVRNDAPDKTECTLSLGEIAGKSTCPEQESFQNRYSGFKSDPFLKNYEILIKYYILYNILRWNHYKI